MNSPSFTLSNFQGPLELLLHLIQKNEVDVFDIPLHTLTNQFTKLLEADDALEYGGDFLISTSSLLLLKSRSLLPGTKGEEGGLDPRLEILEKIREYCAFKKLAKELGEKEALEQNRLPRGTKETPVAIETKSGVEHLSSADLAKLLEKVLLKASEIPQAIREEEWPLPEVLTYMRERLKEDQALPFDLVFAPTRAKQHLITLFLALLELLKLQEAKVVERGEDNIWIEARHER